MAERTAEEWGRIAVSLPGWRWVPGMRWVVPAADAAGRLHNTTETAWWNDPRTNVEGESVPDPDDPATAGCLLALLGPNLTAYDFGSYADEPGENGMRFRVVLYGDNKGKPLSWPPVDCATLGRACIAAAEALGRWPGGGTE